MKYLVISDIHGNVDALDAVLEEALRRPIDSVLVLGDLVGYGASPNEVIEHLLEIEKPVVLIRGNHDKVIATPIRAANFNAVARLAVQWTVEELTEENMSFLEQLEQGPVEVEPGVFICHGSPVDEDEYVLSLEDAALVFARHVGSVTFFGHTHIPSCFTARERTISSFSLSGDRATISLEAGVRYLLNPGSVGQPRDEDPRAAYFVYDSESAELEWRRCAYPIAEAQRRILSAGLPEMLAHRLAVGL